MVFSEFMLLTMEAILCRLQEGPDHHVGALLAAAAVAHGGILPRRVMTPLLFLSSQSTVEFSNLCFEYVMAWCIFWIADKSAPALAPAQGNNGSFLGVISDGKFELSLCCDE